MVNIVARQDFGLEFLAKAKPLIIISCLDYSVTIENCRATYNVKRGSVVWK